MTKLHIPDGIVAITPTPATSAKAVPQTTVIQTPQNSLPTIQLPTAFIGLGALLVLVVLFVNIRLRLLRRQQNARLNKMNAALIKQCR